MNTIAELKAALLAEPAAQVEYDALAPEFDMARELIAARSPAGLTQSDIAQRMGTAPSVIARPEGGSASHPCA